MSNIDQSVLIKDVHKLNIRKEVAERAEQLINLVEYPVVFWINAETDNNYAAIHPENRNQFWITIKSGTVQCEVERIVLANLYKQVQLRKRYMIAMPQKEYLSTLIAKNNIKAQERLRQLQNKINSFTSSLECEMYLAQYGISTENCVRENGFSDRKQKLEEYIDIQRKQPTFTWYREVAVQNLIDYGFYERLERRYEYHLTKLVNRIKPKPVAEQYLRDIEKIKVLITEAYAQYTGDNGDAVISWMLEELIKYFHLDSMLCIENVDTRRARKMVHNRLIEIYTFVQRNYRKKSWFCKVVGMSMNVWDCLES